jgi:8-oxo-dGTP pyrophosphatase MutT (NUDIX family)
MLKSWETLKQKLIFETPIFQLWRWVRRSPASGVQGEFYTLDTPDWVNVIALTPSDEVVLINQFRHGTGEITLEIPGGLVDPGEKPVQSAARELLEETGFKGDEPIFLGTVTPNPAIQDNRCHTYLIRNAEKVREKELEQYEEIEVVIEPLESIPQQIQSGKIHHALVVAGFYYLQLRQLSSV